MATYLSTLAPNLEFGVELSGAGGGWTDLNALGDVMSGAGWQLKRGMGGGDIADRVAAPGTFTCELLNAAKSGRLQGRYTPGHANCTAGWDRSIGVRVRLQNPATDTWHTVFVGRLDDISPTPGSYLRQRVTVTAVDWMDAASRALVTPEIGDQSDARWDAVLTDLVALMEAPTSTSFDTGAEAYSVGMDTTSRQSILSAMVPLAMSELGYIYVLGNGTLRAESRHTRLLNFTSTWTIDDDVPPGDEGALTVPTDRGSLVNVVQTTVHGRDVSVETDRVIYRSTAEIRIEAGDTLTWDVTYRDDDYATGQQIVGGSFQTLDNDGETLTPSTDYSFVNASDPAQDLVDDLTITCAFGPRSATLTAVSAASVAGVIPIGGLQIRGRSIINRGEIVSRAEDAASIATHGTLAVPVDLPYQSSQELGVAAANYLLLVHGDENPRALTRVVLPDTAARLTQVLTRDIGDRVTIQESMTAVNDDHFIHGIELEGLPFGWLKATYTLAPARDPYGTSIFQVNVSNVNGADAVIPF